MVHAGGVLQELIGGVETPVLGDTTLQGGFAVLELDFQLAATKDLVFFVQEDHRLDALGKVDNGGVTGAHQTPLWTKVGIQGENPIAVGIGTHIELVDEGMVIGKGAFEGQILSGHAFDLLLLVFVIPVLSLGVVGFIDNGPLGLIETIWAERKGSWWS